MLSNKKTNFIVFSLVAFCLYSFNLIGEVTYSYTGKPFSDYNSPYESGMGIQGFFTVTNPLNTNLYYEDVSNLVLSYSFSDGVNTLDSKNSEKPYFYLSTDAKGQITNWDIYLVQFDESAIIGTALIDEFISDQAMIDPLGRYLYATNMGEPGAWTGSEIAVPEPATYAMLAGSLAMLSLATFKRRGSKV